jgi:tRNA(Met) C34 N-acetyltransferase TmcA
MNMQAALYNVILKTLSQEQRSRIKRYQHRFRNRIQWYYKTRYGTFSVDELKGDISRRIGSDYEILIVDSAFDRMTPMFRGSVSDLTRIQTFGVDPIALLIEDLDLRTQMGTIGRRRIAEHLAWHHQKERLLTLCASLAHRTRPVRLTTLDSEHSR